MKNFQIFPMFSYFTAMNHSRILDFVPHICLKQFGSDSKIKKEIFHVTQGVLKRAREIESCMFERNVVKSAAVRFKRHQSYALMNYRIIKSILCILHKRADLMTEGIQ